MTEKIIVEPAGVKKRRQAGAVAAIFCVTAIWGAAFVVLKNALTDMTPLYFLFFRFSLATAAMALVCGKRLGQLRLWMLRPMLLVGAALCLGFALQTWGLPQTTASNAAFITGTYVVFVPLFGWFIHRRLSPAQMGLAVVALVGLAVISLNESFRLNPGDLLAFGGAIGFALHFILLGRYTRRMDSLLLTFLQLAGCALFCGLGALIFEPLPTRANFTGQVWFSLLYLSLLSTALAYLVQTAVQKILSPSQASVLFTSETIFGAFFGWLLLDELFAPHQLLGALLLLASMIGVLLLPWLRARKGLPPLPES